MPFQPGQGIAMAGLVRVAVMSGRRGHSVVDQFRDRQDREVVSVRKLFNLLASHHRAVGVHEFAEHRGRPESGEPREVHRSLGVSAPPKHALGICLQRENVPGMYQVVGTSVR